MAHCIIMPTAGASDDQSDTDLIDQAAQALLLDMAEQPIPAPLQTLMQALGAAIETRHQQADVAP